MSKIREFLTVVIFAGFVVYGCDAIGSNKPTAYKMPNISDVNTVVSTSKVVVGGGVRKKLTLSYEADRSRPKPNLVASHSPDFIYSVSENVSRIMQDFLRYRNIKASDCRGFAYNLNVFVVSEDIMRQDHRFGNFYKIHFGQTRSEGRLLYGYYSSTPEIANNSTILVTDVSKGINNRVFAHELAHYWWDRLCLVSYYNGSSEDFAQEFEKFYLRRS